MFLKSLILSLFASTLLVATSLTLATSVLLASSASAVEPNRSAPQGGVFNYNFDLEPESLHPIMSGDAYEQYLSAYVHDTLCVNNIETYEYDPRLAEKWDISKDGLTFTFYLRKDAYFHNGDNVTAEDVKFSLDAIREPKHQALNTIPYVEKLTKVEVLDKYTIRFTASEKYFKKLWFYLWNY